jgi:hypothetical protein
MADEPGTSGQEPNLELPPLLGFGRKKKRKAQRGTDEVTAENSAASPLSLSVGDDSDPLAADPVAPPPRGGLTPAAGTAKRRPPVPPPTAESQSPAGRVPPPPVTEAETESEAVENEAEGEYVEPAPVADPALVGDPTVVDEPVVGDAPGGVDEAHRSEQEPSGRPGDEPTTLLPPVVPPAARPDPPATTPAAAPAERPSFSPYDARVEEPVGRPAVDNDDPTDLSETEPASASPAASSRSFSLPSVNPRIAVAVTGALTGLVAVVLSALASRGCEAVRGVGSCGGLGLLALLVIVGIGVLFGAALLAAWNVYDPVSTSFLGVGLVAVFVLLFLLSSLESVWMILVVPVISALAFLLSLWVTTALVEGADST